MNKKNKVLLGAIGLVLVSGIAATSSTFAWFSTVRNANIAYGDATVYTKDGNLEIKFKESKNTLNPNTREATNDLTLTGTNKVTDISGDGLNFYKPVWSSKEDVASKIDEVTQANDFYVDFTITVSRVDDYNDKGFKVYLGEGTEIVDKEGADNQALNSVVPATRLAVIVGNVVVLRWTPEAETNAQYLVSGTGDAYGTTTHALKNDTELKHGAIKTYTTQAAAADADDTFMVADLSTETEVDVTFRAWIEGCDEQTVNEIIGGVFDVNIALYALAA